MNIGWKVLPYFLLALIIICIVAALYLTMMAAIWLLNEIGRYYGVWTLIAILIVVICCLCGGRNTIIVKTK